MLCNYCIVKRDICGGRLVFDVAWNQSLGKKLTTAETNLTGKQILPLGTCNFSHSNFTCNLLYLFFSLVDI